MATPYQSFFQSGPGMKNLCLSFLWGCIQEYSELVGIIQS